MTKEKFHNHSVINVKLRCPETNKLLHIFNCLQVSDAHSGKSLKAWCVDKYESFEKDVDLLRSRIDLYIPPKYIVRMEAWSSNSYTPHKEVRRGSYDDTRYKF
jgi:hypothetical protein